jgi:Xaa-Pro aminopeptidase
MTQPNRRVEQAVRLMAERGLGGLVVYSDGTCNILRPSYFRYFAGVAPMGASNAAVLSSDGRGTLLVQPAWDQPRIRRHTWVDDVRGADDFADALNQTLRRLDVRGRVGLAGGREMPHPLYSALSAAVLVERADEIVETIAREKSAEELALVRKAAAAADAGFEAFLGASRPGIREFEIVAEVEYAMRRAGADDNFILLSTGPHNRAMRAPTDRQVVEGDIVIGEITPVCEGQFVQLCRTVSVGMPAPILVDRYALLVRAYEQAVKRVRANAPASIIASTIDGILTDAGYGEYCRPPYMRTRGHGFGVGSVAPGALIDADTDQPLINQQVVVVHPNQYLPETGYLACGETVLVTPDGAERLARTETRLYVRAGAGG